MIRKGLTLIFILACFHGLTNGQEKNTLPDDYKIGKHTVSEWNTMVDTTWSEGISNEDKLVLFDYNWNAIDKYYAGFVNHDLDWEAVRDRYRPEIEAGISRGRFVAILSKLSRLLREPHSGFGDLLFLDYEPNPDMPVFVNRFTRSSLTTDFYDDGWFGATVTPVENNKLVVLRCIPDHPLGLEPGDEVLGYDGIAWRELYPLLIELELPQFIGSIAGPDETKQHRLLSSVGMNWHLFDTIDINKYGSEDTLHLPTSLLETEKQNFLCVEQLPLKGIEYPGDLDNSKMIETLPNVLYGTIENTNIAYLYIIHYAGKYNYQEISKALNAIIDENTEGLIIDSRFGYGGSFRWEKGFNKVFNRTLDSCGMYARTVGGTHSELSIVSNLYPYFGTLSDEFLNKPVALLMGPMIISNGDYAAYFIHSQPMSRSFGKIGMAGWTFDAGDPNTPACLTNPDLYNDRSLVWNMGYTDYITQLAGQNFGRIIDGKLEYFLNNYFEIDESLWFTQEAAHNQKDNMVERAVQWIRSVAYADNCRISGTELDINKETESLYIQSGLVNPEDHTVEVSARIFTQKGVFVKDVSMQEYTTGDIPGIDAGEWYGRIDMEEVGDYYAEVSVKDNDENCFLTYPGILEFSVIVGISDATAGYGLSVYPNPAEDYIIIQIENPDNYTLEIISSTGQMLHNVEFCDAYTQVNLASLNAGVYYIRIRSENKIWTGKVVKY